MTIKKGSCITHKHTRRLILGDVIKSFFIVIWRWAKKSIYTKKQSMYHVKDMKKKRTQKSIYTKTSNTSIIKNTCYCSHCHNLEVNLVAHARQLIVHQNEDETQMKKTLQTIDTSTPRHQTHQNHHQHSDHRQK